ncbi:regulatory signaling modulator protein AmpE [Porticoccus sp.]|uniref:regulatory signaling modulator protein AmpE n=1 Tax=Porticoccus sp. TaxID=2024853 RepID=UPI003F69C068
MEFIVIVVGLLLLRQMGSLATIQSDGWFYRFCDQLAGWSKLQSAPRVQQVITLLLPVVVLALVIGLLGHSWLGLPQFVLSLLVFLYALGRGSLEPEVANYEEDLGRGDQQAAYRDVAALSPEHTDDVMDAEQSRLAALEVIAYRYFERYFAVMFWFILAGAPGALLYRLSVIRRDRTGTTGESADAEWLWLLEWLPVRLVGISICFVGNFSACLNRWRHSFFSSAGSAEVLGGYVEHSVPEGEVVTNEAGEEMPANLQALFTRTLIFALSMVALMVVLW